MEPSSIINASGEKVPSFSSNQVHKTTGSPVIALFALRRFNRTVAFHGVPRKAKRGTEVDFVVPRLTRRARVHTKDCSFAVRCLNSPNVSGWRGPFDALNDAKGYATESGLRPQIPPLGRAAARWRGYLCWQS